MDLNQLVGQILSEDQIYEILHFDIEDNFKNYSEKFIHIYFSNLATGKIHIDQISMLQSEDELYSVNRRILGHQGWTEIYDHDRHIDLTLFRIDCSGKFSIVGPDLNLTQNFKDLSYDLPTAPIELNEKECREAFFDLADLLVDHVSTSKPKKAV